MLEREKSQCAKWSFYGSDFGGKVDDLLAFEKEKVEDVEIVPGKAIGASFFRQLVVDNHFDDRTWPDDVIQNGKLPDDLEQINRQILSAFQPETCIVIRSSVVGENNGVGVYSSYFMVTTGDIEPDLKKMAEFELQIYSDYFSHNSRDFLKDKFLDLTTEGVGLLIQEVVGDQYDNFFMPSISGVITTINGELNLRLVLGMGTMAVDVKEAVVLKRDNLRPEVIKKALFGLFEVEAIDLVSGELEMASLEFIWKQKMTEQVEKLSKLIDLWGDFIRQGHPRYAEFAIASGYERAQILQINDETPFEGKNIELGQITGRVLCESNDVINTGSTVGQGIVHLNLNGMFHEDLDELSRFNSVNGGYLLVVNDILFSRASYRTRLELRHFSNAAGVVEKQIIRRKKPFQLFGETNHVNRGGTHFAEICKRKDILFLGVVVPEWDNLLETVLGPFSEKLGLFGGYWDTKFKITNAVDNGRVEIFGELIQHEYSREALHQWIGELTNAAESLESVDKNLSDAFYYLSGYLISALGQSVAAYDPYSFVDHLLPDTLRELNSAIDQVEGGLYLTDSYANYEEGLHYGVSEDGGNVFELKKYLLKLKNRIRNLI